MTADQTARLADLLVAAAREGRTLGVPTPDLVPVDDAAAYAVQAAVLERRGERPMGRKIGYGPDGRVTGAWMAAGGLVAGGGTWTTAAATIGVELEIAVRMGRDLPARPDRPYGAEELMAAVDSVLVAIEIVVRRFADPAKTPYTAVLADAISHAGFVTGAAIPAARFREISVAGTFDADGRTILKGPLVHPNGDWLAPLTAHASAPPAGLGPLRAGEYVTTGSLCGLPMVDVPATVTGSVAGLGAVTVTFAKG